MTFRVYCVQAKAALPMLKARSAGGRQTRSRTAKATPKRASVTSKKDAEDKTSEAGKMNWLLRPAMMHAETLVSKHDSEYIQHSKCMSLQTSALVLLPCFAQSAALCQ